MAIDARQIVFLNPGNASLEPIVVDNDNLGPTELVTRTIASLVSPGTEGASYQGLLMPSGQERSYPDQPGYANVGEVIAAGPESGFAVGDRVFSTAKHVSHARLDTRSKLVERVPDGLAPEKAVFARLAMVSMSTFRTSPARMGDKVAVVGLGLVGNLAAQLAQIGGMETLAIDIIPWRTDLATTCGIEHVLLAPDDDQLHRDYALVIEATGTAAGAMTGMKLVQRHGELSLVGSQWGKGTHSTDTLRLLGTIFEEYVHIRSGWEWQIPTLDTPFGPNAIALNARAILRWLDQGKLVVEPLLSRILSPADPNDAYTLAVKEKDSALGIVFDWTSLA
ncbi:MAG: zinc-binding alcohol dehydrogenase [Thermomicrobiales bacterium]